MGFQFSLHGAVRSARHVVNVKIVGSNPTGGADLTIWHGTQTLEKRRSSNLRDFGGSIPFRATAKTGCVPRAWL